MTLQRHPTAPRDDPGRLVAEFSRLLCDYGPSASYRHGAGKAQANHGVDGWPATGLDATSRMRQMDRAPAKERETQISFPSTIWLRHDC